MSLHQAFLFGFRLGKTIWQTQAQTNFFERAGCLTTHSMNGIESRAYTGVVMIRMEAL